MQPGEGERIARFTKNATDYLGEKRLTYAGDLLRIVCNGAFRLEEISLTGAFATADLICAEAEDLFSRYFEDRQREILRLRTHLLMKIPEALPETAAALRSFAYQQHEKLRGLRDFCTKRMRVMDSKRLVSVTVDMALSHIEVRCADEYFIPDQQAADAVYEAYQRMYKALVNQYDYVVKVLKNVDKEQRSLKVLDHIWISAHDPYTVEVLPAAAAEIQISEQERRGPGIGSVDGTGASVQTEV